MNILQTNRFKKIVKKLHKNQKSDLYKAIEVISKDPDIGIAKVGDIAGTLVYKFKMVKQETLLAYTYQEQTITLTLLDLGSHENFYRDLKRP